MLTWRNPLSPDAFSRFAKKESDDRANNEEIKEATMFLHNTVIPRLALDLDRLLEVIRNEKERKKTDSFSFQVKRDVQFVRLNSMMHGSGINMRKLFRVFSEVKTKPAKVNLLRGSFVFFELLNRLWSWLR